MRIMIALLCLLSLLPMGSALGQEKKLTRIDQTAFKREWAEIQKSYPNFAASYNQWQTVYQQSVDVFEMRRKHLCRVCLQPITDPDLLVTINTEFLLMDARLRECVKRATNCAGVGGGSPGPNQPVSAQDCDFSQRELGECLGRLDPQTENNCDRYCRQ